MFKRKKKKTSAQGPPEYNPPPMPPVKLARPNPTLGWQPTVSTNTKPPNVPTSLSNAVKPSLAQVYDIRTVETMCFYKTPCGWCTKWDKACDKKIECHNDNPPRGLRAKLGIYDEAVPQSCAKDIIETVQSGKLPQIDENTTYGIRLDPIR